MKFLIVAQMALLYFGNLATYSQVKDVSLLDAAATIGVRSGIGVLLLLFILMLIADTSEGGAAIANGLAVIVVFSYLTQTVTFINETVASILGV